MDDITNIREDYHILLQDIAYRKWLLTAGLHETYDIIMVGDKVSYG